MADCHQARLRDPKEGLYILHKLGGYGNDLFLQVVAMKSNTVDRCAHTEMTVTVSVWQWSAMPSKEACVKKKGR